MYDEVLNLLYKSNNCGFYMKYNTGWNRLITYTEQESTHAEVQFQ